MTTFVCEQTFIDGQFDAQSRPIENQYVLSENSNGQILIDLFEYNYDAKNITKKKIFYPFSLIHVCRKTIKL